MNRLFTCCLLLTFTVLPGCSHHAAEPRNTVHLTVWSMWTGPEEQNFLRVLRRYHQEHPNIIVDNLGAVTDDTKTVRAIVAGVPPDMFTLSDPLFLGPLAANGAIFTLDDRFRQAGLREEQFVPGGLRECRYHGRLYGLPFLIDDLAFIWNRKSFRSAGINPDLPPQTIKEMSDDAVKLTRRDAGGNITQLGLQPLTVLPDIFQVFGGSLYDERTGRITADDPNNVRALAWYKSLVERLGGYEKVNAFSSGFGAQQSANNPFFVGKIAMKWDGEWTPYWVKKYAAGLQYGVGPIPPPADRPDRARSTWLGGNVFCIPKDSKHPKEAWDLMVWMQSDEAQIYFASMMNNVPNTRSALHSPRLRTGAPYKVQYSKFLDLADSPNAGSFPALPVANLYNAELQNAQDYVLDGSKTPERALRDVRVRVQRELDRYR